MNSLKIQSLRIIVKLDDDSVHEVKIPIEDYFAKQVLHLCMFDNNKLTLIDTNLESVKIPNDNLNILMKLDKENGA